MAGKMQPPMACPGRRLRENLRNGLALWLPMNEGDGDKAFDRSVGGENTGTLTGSPTWVVGEGGPALDFDGSADYVHTSFSPRVDLGSGSPFSMSAWIYPGDLVDQQVILGDVTGSMDRFFVALSSTSVQVGLGNSNDTTGITVSADEWAHIAVVYDGASTSVYKNAGLPDEHAFVFCTNYTIACEIGRRTYRGGSSYFFGRIASPTIWNRALTPSEIQQLYADPYEDNARLI